MLSKLICPCCNTESVVEVNRYCTLSDKVENTFTESCRGYCTKCDTKLIWDKVYTFTGYKDIIKDFSFS